MTMLLQEFLRAGGTFADLAEKYAIKVTRHSTHRDLVLFKYDQINSPMGEPLVRECRGCILDQANEWECVSRSFDKFFNHGEGNAAHIDWHTAKVQEKVDGSLCSMYFYDGKWHVATTGSPDASGDVNGSGRIFADLFWETLRTYNCEPPDDWQGWTFLFELSSPENRVVVRHHAASLTVLGMRRAVDGAWEHASEAAQRLAIANNGQSPHAVSEFPLQSIDDISATFATMNPLQQEGYVIVDDAFNRIKVKHPGYVALHHAKDGLSLRAFVDIARKQEVPEVIIAFPELATELNAIRDKFDALAIRINADYTELRDIPVQKDFALKAKDRECPAALFSLRSGKSATVRDFFATMTTDGAIRMLGLKVPTDGGVP